MLNTSLVRKIRLKFKSVSEIVGSTNLALLVLTDVQEQKQISIVCEQTMALQLSLRASHSPLSKTFLPEVLWQALSLHSDSQFEVLINGLVDGQYRAIFYDTATLTPISIGVSDAVLLSLIGDVPLYIEESLMYRQSVSFRDGSEGIAIPVNTLNIEMLKDALDKAIENENYELASHLRDEMRRRKIDNPLT